MFADCVELWYIVCMLWCKACGQSVNSNICPTCKSSAQEDIPTQIMWCNNCMIPIIQEVTNKSEECPLCKGKILYLSTDIRPCFPEERLWFELIKGIPLKYLKDSVWVNNNKYYVNGKVINLASTELEKLDANYAKERLLELQEENRENNFDKYIILFVRANENRLAYIKDEAFDYIRKEKAKGYTNEQIITSFSGGKDSTVVADLVVRALGDPSIVHIFGDTTLEFPLTHAYVARYRKENSRAIFRTARNKDNCFFKVAEEIGPPARMMRWCCTMFKTGPITRTINSLFAETKILTFYGVRKNESVSRSKYNRTEDDGTAVKILRQKVASPIFFWSDAEIWLYILGENIDFNDAYRLGYDRVGCWLCPNNNQRAQELSKIYMKEDFDSWRDFLVKFAKSVGKPDAEVYVDSGAWKARQGGAGVAAAESVKIKHANCTAEENAKIYSVENPINDDFHSLFTPFGKVSKELGRKIVDEVLVLDLASMESIISIQPMNTSDFRFAVKIKVTKTKSMSNSKFEDLQRMIAYQIRKWNACRQCLKCESLCKYGAIAITKSRYAIDEKKCKKCKVCVSQKHLVGGCLMSRFLKQRSGIYDDEI